jgi:L-alanine-DL-glutamate epimerase-like enolase superfamily enzyme
MLDCGAAHIIMPDIAWCGGLTETRKIAAIADSYHRPIAPHDCQGPVVLQASVHMSLSAPNVLIQESVRAFYASWYGELVDNVPAPKDGYFLPPEGPGLGLALLPAVARRADATVVISKAD